MLTAQEHAQAYWASRPVKKWVVTVQGGGAGSISAWKREVYVSARNGGRAIRCAREQALFPSMPRGVAVRLATWVDLGCVLVNVGDHRTAEGGPVG